MIDAIQWLRFIDSASLQWISTAARYHWLQSIPHTWDSWDFLSLFLLWLTQGDEVSCQNLKIKRKRDALGNSTNRRSSWQALADWLIWWYYFRVFKIVLTLANCWTEKEKSTKLNASLTAEIYKEEDDQQHGQTNSLYRQAGQFSILPHSHIALD